MEMSMSGMGGLERRARRKAFPADALHPEDRDVTAVTAEAVAAEILRTPKQELLSKRDDYLRRIGEQTEGLERLLTSDPDNIHLNKIKGNLGQAREKILTQGPERMAA